MSGPRRCCWPTKTIFREGLVALLASYRASEVIGETTNDEEPLVLARRMKPDVVIIQVQMPFEKTKEALDRICAVEPSPKVMVVTMFEDPAPFVLFEAGDQRLRAQECFIEAARRRGSPRGLRLRHDRRL